MTITQRILFVCPPFRGHCTPMLLQAAALARRGHDVAIALAADCGGWVEEANRALQSSDAQLTHLGWGVQLDSPEVTAALRARICRERSFMYGAALYTAGELMPVIRRMYDALPALIDRIAAWGAVDALCIDSITLPGYDLAAILGAPHVAICSLPLNLAAPPPRTVPRSFTGFTAAELSASCVARVRNATQPLRYEMMLATAAAQLGQLGTVLAVARARSALQRSHPRALRELPGQWTYLRRCAVLVTTAFGFEPRRAVPANVVLVGPQVPSRGGGGGKLRKQKTVDVALHKWLDACVAKKTRVVYVAFGSMVPLPPALARAILHGLLQMTQRFRSVAILWSARDPARLGLTGGVQQQQGSGVSCGAKEEGGGGGVELRLEAWVDQPTVLAHEAVELFVTHCGMNSVMEALDCGVPLLGVPMWNDQTDVAARIVQCGAGLRVDWKQRSGWHGKGAAASSSQSSPPLGAGPSAFAEQLRACAEQLLCDPSFADAARATARQMQQVGGVEFAADLIERCGDGSLDYECSLAAAVDRPSNADAGLMKGGLVVTGARSFVSCCAWVQRWVLLFVAAWAAALCVACVALVLFNK